jgi:hypothetical protein
LGSIKKKEKKGEIKRRESFMGVGYEVFLRFGVFFI